jgi:hypothetical protein
VNGGKYARIFAADYSKTIYPTYEGYKALVGWEIYDIKENLISTILPDQCFIPENEGKYYFVAILSDPDDNNI